MHWLSSGSAGHCKSPEVSHLRLVSVFAAVVQADLHGGLVLAVTDEGAVGGSTVGHPGSPA